MGERATSLPRSLQDVVTNSNTLACLTYALGPGLQPRKATHFADLEKGQRPETGHFLPIGSTALYVTGEKHQ